MLDVKDTKINLWCGPCLLGGYDLENKHPLNKQMNTIVFIAIRLLQQLHKFQKIQFQATINPNSC